MTTPRSQRNTVLIVEDEPVTRERLVEAVSSQPLLQVMASTGSLRAGQEIFANHHPRVALIDLGLPDGSGLDLISQIHQANCGTESLVLTVFGDEQHVVSALKAGARGYLLKDSSFAAIADHLLMLIDGGSPINPKVARFLLGQFGQWEKHSPPADQSVTLTDREKEILNHITKGYKRGEIAQLLNISNNTVGTHIRRIYEKLSVHSNIEATREAVSLGLFKNPL
ncbi:MAG: response regulator transcription factor [Ferrovum sp.]|nr:response regulator transcription factor [Ferrovum sp.]NDU87783.1 response regulator transcription factor [Ferrovum sp.]